MSIFSRRKQQPRHALAAVRAEEAPARPEAAPDLDDITLTDKPMDILHPAALTASARDETMVFRIPGIDGGPGLMIPPATLETPDPEDALPHRSPGAAVPPASVPSLRTEPADPDMLRDLADALRALPDPPAPRPVAWLRACEHDGQQAVEELSGTPSFAGLGMHPDGTPVAGVYLGIHAGGTWLVDVVDPAWCEDAITALTAVRDHLTAAREQAEGGAAA